MGTMYGDHYYRDQCQGLLLHTLLAQLKISEVEHACFIARIIVKKSAMSCVLKARLSYFAYS